jgi:glycosyltransferase involved in cell wall biosynthesis
MIQRRSKLRVLHLLTNAFDPEWNWDGDPVSRVTWPVSAILRHTDAARFEVFIGTLTPPPENAGDIPGLRLHVIPARGRRAYPAAIVALARWLKARRIDVVQTHLYDANVVGLLAARLARTPVTIATGHHSHEFAVRPRGLAYWVDALCVSRLAGHAIVPSRFMRDTVAALYGMPAERIAVVTHGLDARRLATSPGARDRIRRELGLEGRVVLGGIGRLFWIKQYANLLRSFAAATTARPETTLLLIGDGPQREALQALARQLGVEERVMFLGLRGDVMEVLAAMDLFVHPALTESFGLVIVEAMAAAKPVLSTAVGIAPDVIADGETGMLVPPRDPDALTRGLDAMLAARGRWDAMGRRAQEVAREFTAPRMVAAYEALYLDWYAASGAGDR